MNQQSIAQSTTSKSTVARNALFIGGAIFSRGSFGSNHPLSYARQSAVTQLCSALGWLQRDNTREAPTASPEVLGRFHDTAYVEALLAASNAGKTSAREREVFRFGTMENPIFPGVFERAATTVGGAILAAELALEGYIAFHPAGGTHHGRPDRASGFCYFNDPVFAILTFLDAGLERILYLDIDAHHGDGVFDAFADDIKVACVSIHEADRWPYSGIADEQSERALNIPLPQGANDAEFELAIEALVAPFAERFAPQAVVITCGADALSGDPLSKMQLSNHTLWNAVLKGCDLSPHAVVLGGGGYNPWTTVRCWAGLWGRLSGQELPSVLPPTATAILSRFESDLVDEEDVEPFWLSLLNDPKNASQVRREAATQIQEISAAQGLN